MGDSDPYHLSGQKVLPRVARGPQSRVSTFNTLPQTPSSAPGRLCQLQRNLPRMATRGHPPQHGEHFSKQGSCTSFLVQLRPRVPQSSCQLDFGKVTGKQRLQPKGFVQWILEAVGHHHHHWVPAEHELSNPPPSAPATTIPLSVSVNLTAQVPHIIGTIQ